VYVESESRARVCRVEADYFCVNSAVCLDELARISKGFELFGALALLAPQVVVAGEVMRICSFYSA